MNNTPTRWSSTVADWVTVAVGLSALVLGGSMYFGDERTEQGPREDRVVDQWDALAQGGRRVGAADARVTIVEFIDYECAFCRRMHSALKGILSSFPEDVAVVYRHYPLSYHPNAYTAAILAECAAQQDRFEPVHDLLYSAVTLEKLDPSDVAAAAGVPGEEVFLSCVSSKQPDRRIQADLRLANEIGVTGTPALIINGVYLGANPDSVTLDRQVAALLSED